MLKEMKLYLVLLVLIRYLPPSKTYPTSRAEWKQSRFIINNKRNFLFNKPFIEMYTKAVSITPNLLKFSNETTEKERQSHHEANNQKDLNVEASVEENYYQQYRAHSLPTTKINYLDGGAMKHEIKGQLNENSTSKLNYNPQNFIETKKDYNFYNLERQMNSEGNKKLINERLTWMSNENKDEFVLTTSERVSISAVRTPLGLLHREKAEDEVDTSTLSFKLEYSTPQEFGLITTTTSFPWEYDERKSKEEEFADKRSRANEKRTFKTRIETVNYHQQTVFNPSELVSDRTPGWYQQNTYKEPIKGYEEGDTIDVTYEESYEQTEKNYDEEEKIHDEKEKIYEEEEKIYEEEEKIHDEEEKIHDEEEKIYEEEEKIYDEGEIYEEEEKNYEEEEKNYEEEEKNYEKEEMNYEKEHRNYEEEEKNYEEEEKNYEEEEKNYEEEEKNYEKEETNYEQEYRNYEEEEKTYEEEEKNYEKEEMNYEQEEKDYKEEQKNYDEKEKNYIEKVKNYEVNKKNHEEKRNHNEKEQTIDNSANRSAADNSNKFGYVVEEKNYRKYRVEEKTIDGFIVGEYGVVSHNDGSLRGVRYTADGTANPQLIHKALIKFLSL